MLGGSKTKTPTLASWGRKTRTLPAWGGHPHSHPYQREQQNPGPIQITSAAGTSLGGAENRTTSPHLEEEKYLTSNPKKREKREKKKKEV